MAVILSQPSPSKNPIYLPRSVLGQIVVQKLTDRFLQTHSLVQPLLHELADMVVDEILPDAVVTDYQEFIILAQDLQNINLIFLFSKR
jgi:hypothetical protein